VGNAARAADPESIVGRETERARLRAFADAVPLGARALVLRGEPGIGKSALWRHAVALARGSGHELLVTRPAAEEMALALGGLDELAERLPFDTSGDGDDAVFQLGRALLAALRDLAASRPVVIAIDDLQWLDTASARVLRYALRRLDEEPVGLLATLRPGTEDPVGCASALPPGRVETVDLGPLDVGELRAMLAGTVAAISRPVLLRIHEVSGGNPLYAIELARAPESGLPLPDSLQGAIQHRLAGVPAELLPLLQTVAAVGTIPARDLQQTFLDGHLTRARADGLLTIDEQLHVRFTHPLIASAVYAAMDPLTRQELHAGLARAAADEDLRARHLALSRHEPDEDVAARLEAAATRAGARGAHDAAATFARHSVRLTPPADLGAVTRRTLGEVAQLAASGEVNRALALADALIDRLPAGRLRAEALLQRAQLEDDDLESGEALLVRALDDAGDDDRLRGRVLDQLGWLRGIFRGDLHAGIRYAREALVIAERAGDPAFEMSVACGLSNMEALAGSPRRDLIDLAVSLEDELGRPLLWAGPRVMLGEQLLWAGELDRARAIFEAALADARRSGNERWRPYVLYDLASVEVAAGELQRADALVGEAVQAARDSEDAHVESWILQRAALVAAWLGREQEARAIATQGLDEAARRGERQGIIRTRRVLGLLALSTGDAETAARELGEAADLLAAWGVANPGPIAALPDAIEALALLRTADAAAVLLERMEDEARALDNAWVHGLAERSRGLVLLAQGRPGEAIEPLDRAIARFDRTGHRPDAARAALARGRALLRANQRTSGADGLADARRRFAEMGARLWEARAAAELDRAAPGRASGELTAAEARVAVLVADGLRNRDIATRLYMSVATVEAHLTRTYRKLQIGGRSELVRLVAEGVLRLDEGDPDPPSRENPLGRQPARP
jgi:DNA-binding CsgD family transcriptional regulator